MKLFKILGVALLGLALTVPQAAYAAGATATPYAVVTPSAVKVSKNVGTSANFYSKFITVECTVDPTNMAASDNQVFTCTVPGVATGDRVSVMNPNSGDTAVNWCALPVAAWVSAADTVKWRVVNVAGATCDGASTAYSVQVTRANPN